MSMTIPAAPLPAPAVPKNRPDSAKREHRHASSQDSNDATTETSNEATCANESQTANAPKDGDAPATFADILATIVFGGVTPTVAPTVSTPVTPATTASVAIATSPTDLLASLQVQVALATDTPAIDAVAIATATAATAAVDTDAPAPVIDAGVDIAPLTTTPQAPTTTPVPTMAVDDVVGALARDIAELAKTNVSPITISPEIAAKLVAPEISTTEQSDVDIDITSTIPVAPATGAQPLEVKIEPVATRADTQAVFDQIAQQISTVKHRPDGTYRIAIQLHPEDLGQLSVQVEVKNGIVDIRFRADNADTRDLLRSSEHALRIHLEESGVSAGNVDVGDMARRFGSNTPDSATRGTNTKDFDEFADEFTDKEPAAQGRVAAAIMTDRELDVQM